MSLVKGFQKFIKDGNGDKFLITKVNQDGTINIRSISTDGKVISNLDHMPKEYFIENTVDSLEEAKKKPYECHVPEKIKRRFTNIPQPADGNCLFYCFAAEANMTEPNSHNLIRQEICNYMRDNKQTLLQLPIFVDGLQEPIERSFDRYIENMRKDRVWGGIPEIYVAMLITKQEIELYNSNGDLNRAFETLKNGLRLDSKKKIILFLCSSMEDAKEGLHFELLIPKGIQSVDEQSSDLRAVHLRDESSHLAHGDDKHHRRMFPNDLSADISSNSVRDINRLFALIDRDIKFYNTLLDELKGLKSSEAIKKKQEKLDRKLTNILETQTTIINLYEEYKRLLQVSQEAPRLINLQREIEELLTKKDRITQELLMRSDEEYARRVQGGQFGGNINYKNKYLLYKKKYLLLKEKMNK
jgi:hypothetical protein